MLKKIALLSVVALSLSACASIIGKSDYPVSINSNPQDIDFLIKDESGKTVRHLS
jgi:hypothetical protein